MDDSCAVCAEPLQWVAYGPCGHREVCSTCVVRMRFICEDRHCCLCKSEARIIFITKALGDYTRMINDFTMFSADPREGQVGMYWYHEGTQAYFDDVDQYKMVKAMCKLFCSACDKRNEWSEGVRGKGDYMNVELLKIHLAQRHRLSMCSLCLEGRKVFICEQKLYTKAQLDQHIRSGDSEVDGSETERGGFMGHPICQFCEMPYYGENELYSHMQTGHYMCHICQKQHPGKYEYYKNYDDLEIHFRLSHFLCEDRDCLEKKFVVFTNESEMKRHNALEHGGKMSRAQRSAALQIPVSFQFRQPSYQDRRRGRRFNSDSTSDQFPQESRGTHETSDPRSFRATSPNARAISNQRELQTSSFGLAGSFELLNVLEGESSSVHPCDIRSSSTISTQLEASSFPPLPAAPSKNKKKNKNVVGGGMSGNAPVSRLHQNNRNISQAWSTPHGPPKSLIQSFPQLRPVSNPRPLSSSSLLSISSGNHQIRSTPRNTNSSSSSSSGSRTASVVQTKPHEVLPSTAASSSRKLPNLLGRGSFEDPILAARSGKPATGNQVLQKSEDVKAANKSLVERVRLALAYDENSYASFKKVSSQFRHGVINTEEYLAWVCQFGLSHLVLELAKLCPDLDKQRELIETYKFNTGKCILNECGSGNKSSQSKNQRSSNKGKEKCEDNEGASINNRTSGIKDLKSNGTTDGLLTNGHQSAKAKGKAKAVVEENGTGLGSQATEWKGLSRSSGTSRGGNKPPPKVSKFLKNRLGDAAAASLHSELNEEDKDPPEVLPVSGAWQNGGGRKLLAMTQKDRKRR